MFVELENTVEGLIHISHLKQDYFNFIEATSILLGERTGVSYRIGGPCSCEMCESRCGS